VNICPSGTYANSISQSCNLCPYSCSNCISSLNCTTCINNYTLTSTNQCKPNISNCTSPNCQYCSPTSQSQCSQCLPSYNLFNSTCINSCPTGTYSQNGQCIACQVNCIACTAASCLSCNNLTYYYQGSCIYNCPTGTFSYAGNCQADPCLSYNSATNDCLLCVSPYLLFNKTMTGDENNSYLQICVSTCPSGTVQSGSSCNACPQSCLSCISTSICTNCSAGAYLYQGQCQYSCPLGTYSFNSTCQSCTLSFCTQCAFIGGVQTCISCDTTTGTFLISGICVLLCPTGTYP
jgi:proprotein convertase subtilisin/kexin type 5